MTVDAAGSITTPARRLGRSDRLQPVLLLAAIGAGLAIGRTAPELADAAAAGVSFGVFLLIALVMMSVDPRNVANAFTHRRFLSAALVGNFVVNPIIAWGLGSVFLADEPDLRIGLILFLVTPCVGWYLVFTDLAGGDTELGVGLLGLNLVLQIALLPVYLAFFVGNSATVDVSTILRSVAVHLVAPAVLVAVVRRGWSNRAGNVADVQQRLRISTLKSVVLAVVIVSMFTSQADLIFDEIGAVRRLVVPMILFFGLAFAIATITARRLRLPHEQTALLVFTTTSRNSEASLAIAATAFANPLVALTVALGPVIELPLLIAMVRVLRKSGTPAASEKAVVAHSTPSSY